MASGDGAEPQVATRDHAVPDIASDNASYLPPARFAEPAVGRRTALALDERKPNPQGLISLMRRWRVSLDEKVYVGDSLSRDVAMPQAAGHTTCAQRMGGRTTRSCGTG
jgi:histidinol phosphatase-like enzyme